MIIPELPSLLESLGGADYKGWIIALFTLTAGLSRPLSGKLADLIGRKPIIYVGILVCVVCSLIYPFVLTVHAFLLLRFIHGFSTGFSPTALTAYVADIVPMYRRGEAMGVVGMSISLGSSMSPLLGSYLTNQFGLNTMFVVSSIIAVIALLLLWGIEETLAQPRALHLSMFKLRREELIYIPTLLPALVCGLCYFGYGSLLIIVPDQSDFLQITNKGLYLSSFTLCSVLGRLFMGRVSDIMGRLITMRIGSVALGVSYVVLSYALTPAWLIIGSGLVGFATGIVLPAVFAWTIDISKVEDRGRGLATLFIGLEFGIGFGALVGAWIYANNPFNFKYTFFVMAIMAIFALIFIREPRTGQASVSTT